MRTSLLTLSQSIALLGVLSGCSGYTGPRSVANPDPAVKIPQIRMAVEANDRSVLPQLVQDLDSNDAAVRFYAIGALKRLTGETFDYDWTASDRHVRRPFIQQWEQYLAALPSGRGQGRP